MRPATTYSPNTELGVSTIGPDRLNFRVRNGNGCIPAGNITDLMSLSSKIQGREVELHGPDYSGMSRRKRLIELAPLKAKNDRRIRPSLTGD